MTSEFIARQIRNLKRKGFTLNSNDKRIAKQYRITKCGADDFQQMKLAFEKYLKMQEKK